MTRAPVLAPIAELAVRLVGGALPWVSEEGMEVVRHLAARAPRVIDAEPLARRLGLGNRHALGRLLQRAGLPPYRELQAWIRVLVLVLEWEERGVGLHRSAQAAGRTTSGYSRVVQRVTRGIPWREVRVRGSAWLLLQMVERCRTPGEELDARAVAG